MAITFVNGATTVVTSASPVVNNPATPTANDIWLCCAVSNTAHNSTGTPPTGWAKLHELDDDAGDCSGSTFWKRATGSEGATTTWTSIFDASEICMWLILAYRGCDTGASVINAQGTPEDSASGTAKDSPTLTPSVNDCAIVAFFGADPGSDPQVFTPDASINYRAGGSVAPIDSQDGVSTLVVALDRILSGGSGTPITLGGDFSVAEGCVEFSYALAPAAAATGSLIWQPARPSLYRR